MTNLKSTICTDSTSKRKFIKGIGASALAATMIGGIKTVTDKVNSNNFAKSENSDKKINVSIHPNAVKRTSRG